MGRGKEMGRGKRMGNEAASLSRGHCVTSNLPYATFVLYVVKSAKYDYLRFSFLSYLPFRRRAGDKVLLLLHIINILHEPNAFLRHHANLPFSVR
jgi:hypothetical protein